MPIGPESGSEEEQRVATDMENESGGNRTPRKEGDNSGSNEDDKSPDDDVDAGREEDVSQQGTGGMRESQSKKGTRGEHDWGRGVDGG